MNALSKPESIELKFALQNPGERTSVRQMHNALIVHVSRSGVRF